MICSMIGWKLWAYSMALILIGAWMGRGMAVLDILAVVSVASLGYFAYAIMWATRNAGPFRVRSIPLVALQGGGGAG
jgi:hypothetical protein